MSIPVSIPQGCTIYDEQGFVVLLQSGDFRNCLSCAAKGWCEYTYYNPHFSPLHGLHIRKKDLEGRISWMRMFVENEVVKEKVLTRLTAKLDAINREIRKEKCLRPLRWFQRHIESSALSLSFAIEEVTFKLAFNLEWYLPYKVCRYNRLINWIIRRYG